MLAKKSKRFLATLLAAVMLLGMLPASALATAENRNQVTQGGGTNYYFADENSGGPTTDKGKANVLVTKSMVQAKDRDGNPIENRFTVNLNVTAKMSVDKIHYSADTAVVIVLDSSSSMFNSGSGLCKYCGKKYETHDGYRDYCVDEHGNHIDTNHDGKDDRWDEANRAEIAEKAAKDFLDQYAASANGAARYVCIVSFDRTGRKTLKWTNVAEAGNLADAKAGVKFNTKNNNGTNMEAGLLLARNNLLYGFPTGTNGKTIENTYVVFLTDGEPEVCHAKGNQDTELTATDFMNGDSRSDNAKWAVAAAKRVKGIAEEAGALQSNAVLYTIGCGAGLSDAWKNWLKDSIATPGKAINASNLSQLTAAFTAISEDIQKWPEAWVVTDPLNGNYQFVETANLDDNSASYGAQTRTLSWDLKSAPPSEVSNGEVGYTFSYDVILDNTGLNGSGAPQPLNPSGKDTILKYVLVDGNGQPISSVSNPYEAVFAKPAAEAYYGTLNFSKASFHQVGGQNIPLAGAEFTLTHDDANCPCGLDNPAVKTVTATSGAGGEVEFSGIPSGHKYILTETKAPDGYVADSNWKPAVDVKWSHMAVAGADLAQPVTNKLDPQEVSVTVTKEWVDGNNKYNQRPTSLEVTLTGSVNGEAKAAYTYDLTLSGDMNAAQWTGTQTVPTIDQDTGLPISYAASEELGDSAYTLSAGTNANVTFTKEDGRNTSGSVTLTNNLNNETQFSVTKIWLAPEDMQTDVTINLMGGGKVADSVSLSGDKLTDTFKKVPVYAEDGSGAIAYTVVEPAFTASAQFESPLYGGSMAEGFTVTNAVKQQTFTINGTKEWIDGGSRLNDGPYAVYLYSVGTGEGGTDTLVYTTYVDSSNHFTFTDVPMYDIQRNEQDGVVSYTGTGARLTYKVTDSVSGYDAAEADVPQPTLDENESTYSSTVTLTNSREDLDLAMPISGTKIWVDSENRYDTRPEDGITLTLQKRTASAPSEVWEDVAETVIMPDEDTGNWAKTTNYTFGDQPVYDTDTGAAIVYRVVEKNVPGQYVASGGYAGDNYSITNTLDNGSSGVVSVTVTKEWLDPYTDEQRAEALGEGGGAQFVLTGDNGTSYIADRVLTADDTYTFSGLPKFASGALINYTVSEDAIPGYTTAPIPALTPDTQNPNAYKVTVTNTIGQAYRDITITKTWVDDFTDKADRPDMELVLKQDDTVLKTLSLSDMTTTDNMVYTYAGDDLKGLPYYDLTTGKPYAYTLTETLSGAAAVCFDKGTPSYTDEDGTMAIAITNTFNPKPGGVAVSVSGVKTWVVPVGAELPESVTVELWRDGDDGVQAKFTDTTITAANANVNGDWQYSFSNLDKYSATDGHEYTYTVKETPITGYTPKLQSDGTTITNTSTALSDVVEYRVTKTWVGPVEDLPESLNVTVTGSDGNEYSYDLTAAENWEYTFRELPKYDAVTRDLVTYSARETNAVTAGGVTTIQAGGLTYVVTSQSASNAYETHFTNTVAQNSQLSINGTKHWPDELPEDFTLPESITVDLYADGAKVRSDETVGADGDWSYSFAPLPEFALEGNGVVNASDGHRIAYSVKEHGGETGTALFQQNGKYFFFAVTGGEAQDGVYDLTNTYTKTETYKYKVIGNYAIYVDNIIVSEKSNVVLEDETLAGQGDLITKLPEQYASSAGDGELYNFKSEGSVTGVTLDEPNKTYELVLNYEIRRYTVPYSVVHQYTYDGEPRGSVTENFRALADTTISLDDIARKTEYQGTTYDFNGGSPDSVQLVLASGVEYKFVLDYVYNTPYPGDYTVNVLHVAPGAPQDVVDALAAHNSTASYTVGQPYDEPSPVAPQDIPAGYKLLSETPERSGGTGRGEVLEFIYTYVPLDQVALTVKHNLMRYDDEGNLEFVRELTGAVTETHPEGYEYSVLPGEFPGYAYLDLAEGSAPASGRLVMGQDLTVTLNYVADRFQFRVDFINDYTHTTIETVWNNDMVAEFGTQLENADVALYFTGDNWQTSRMPTGYTLGNVTFPVIGVSGEGVYSADGSSFDASAVTNIVEVHYGYTEPGPGPDPGPEPDPGPYEPPEEQPGPIGPIEVYPPEIPGNEIEIVDEETPLADRPELPETDEVEILDEEVPLGNLPQTGTTAMAATPWWTLGLLALMSSLAAAGLSITFSRKREEEEEN